MTHPRIADTHLDIHLSSERKSAEERAQLLQNPMFGRVFSDHMALIPYKEGSGWQRGEIKPYGPLSLSPAANVLHYGQAIFEGFKAYRQPDGGIKSFRPYDNARRFNESAKRMAMPALPVELFVEAADQLCLIDQDWVPGPLDAGRIHDNSYYFRPFMIGVGEFIGVKPAEEFLFLLIGGPAGPYFPGGIRPVTIWVEEEFVRASPGGTGRAKCAGNYAASLLPGKTAKQRGCDQVLYLDAIHRKYLEELGGMNVFFVLKEGSRNVIITPEKTGTILEGITRESLIDVAGSLGFAVEERRISIDDIEEAHKKGNLLEAFACGTAAVITPIGTFMSGRGQWTINNNQVGRTATQLRSALLDIQYGLTPDTRKWMHTIT